MPGRRRFAVGRTPARTSGPFWKRGHRHIPNTRAERCSSSTLRTPFPRARSITSAILTITVKDGSGDSSRRIGAYQVTTSWTENEVTWNERRTATYWGSAGGDLGAQITEKVVGNAGGTRVSFDVTPLVQQAVAGSLGASRYTRIALIDLDGSTKRLLACLLHVARHRLRALRPTLEVTYGSRSAAAAAGANDRIGTDPARAALQHRQERVGHR